MNRLPAPPLPGWLAAHLPYERYRVDVGDGAMHVMEVGEGRPVLLVHGNPTWGFLWRRVAQALSGEPLRLIMPDLMGLGLSDKPRSLGAHSLAAHRRWLSTLVGALDLQGVVGVCQDWGGPILGAAMADHPERLAGLVVLNTALGPPKPGFKATAFHRLSHIPILSEFVFRGLGFPQVNLAMAQGDKASIRGEVARAYRYPLRGLAANAAPLALARMVPDSLDHPSVPELARVEAFIGAFTGPAAIVWGERDPILGRLARRASRLLPQAKVTLTQAGHFLQEEVPVEIAAAVRDVAGQLGA